MARARSAWPSTKSSPLNAKAHVLRILIKLGARDRVQLVVMAYERHLVQPASVMA